MIVILVITVILLYVLWDWSNMLRDRNIFNMPGPFPLPITGNGHLLVVKETEVMNTLGNIFTQYGDTVRLNLLSQAYILSRQAEVFEGVLSNNDLNTKGISYAFVKPLLGDGLITSTGLRWKNHRKFLTPAFHFNILQNFLPIFIKNEKILLKKLESLEVGEPVDLFPMITLAALDNVSESVMGVSINALQSTESEYVKNIELFSSISAARIRNIVFTVDSIFKLTPYYAKQTKILKYLHNYTRKVIQSRREELKNMKMTQLDEQTEFGTKNKYAFLDLLLLAEVNGEKIPDEWIREEVDTFLFAGHDTTSSAIVYTLYSIAKHPDIQEKVITEQKDIFKNDFTRDIKYSDLALMTYLGLVIRESLRLYPPVPLIERLVTKDVQIAGYNLTKGTPVMLDILHLQRHPAYYKNPLEFNPDRFADDKDTNSFSWVPFSAGARNCIGQKFAIMEIKATVSAIVRKFKLSAVDRTMDFTANLVLKSPSGVYVTLKPRKL